MEITRRMRAVEKVVRLIFVMGGVIALMCGNLYAATKTVTTTGNWSNASICSPSGVPTVGDDIIVSGSKTLTIDGNYTCRNFYLGNSTAGTTTAQISVATNSLTITGELRINPNNTNNTYTLNSGPGAINVSGTFGTWGTSGTNTIRTGSGSLTFIPDVTISSATQNITFTGAGTITFQGNFSDNYNKLVTFTGCSVYFQKAYTVSTTAASWASKGTAYFSGTNGAINANSNLTLYNVQILTSDSVTLNNLSGSVIIGGSCTLASGSAFRTNKSFEINGAWVNNGGNLWGGSNTITFNTTTTIGGTTSTSFPILKVGQNANANNITVTLNNNNNCTELILDGNGKNRALTWGNTSIGLTVSGNVTVNQPSSTTATSTINVNGGTFTVGGVLNFDGTSNSAYNTSVVVGAGTLNLNGGIDWMSNTAVSTELISLTTGTLNINSSTVFGSGSGSLTINTGTININSSFSFGSATNAPGFTAGNCTVNLNGTFTNYNNLLSLGTSSNTYVTGNSTLTTTGPVYFGNFQINTGKTLSIGSGNMLIAGNWTNNGTVTIAANDTISFTGSSKTIGGASNTIFAVLQIGTSNGTVATSSYTLNTNTSCSNLILEGNTLQRKLTCNTGTALTISGNAYIVQPTANSITNSLSVNAGSCNISGNLYFIGTSNTATRISEVAVTSGTFTLAGTLNWMSNTEVVTERITVTTGNLFFNSSVVMGSGSGTIISTSTGKVYFRGTTAPSLSASGTTSPIISTVSGTQVFFKTGASLDASGISIHPSSTAIFENSGTIFAGSTLAFGNIQINSGAAVALSSDLRITGNWTNNGGSLTAAAYLVVLEGNGKTIGGTSTTSFGAIQLGSSSVTTTVSYTLNKSATCSRLSFNANTAARTFTISASQTLTTTGSITISQPTGNATNQLSVNTGSCTIGGNLEFTGTADVASQACKAVVTTGSLTINGNVTWMSNTISATEVISVTSGNITLSNPLTMGSGSGTLTLSAVGTINFNGTSATSFVFGGATAPVFNTASGCILNFKKGISCNGSSLSFNANSTARFTGNGTITGTSPLTLGHVTILSGVTITGNGRFALRGNWSNSGTFNPSTSTVIFSGTGTQTISRGSGETYYNLVVTNSASTLSLLNNVLITDSLYMTGHNIDMGGNTLTLGNNAPVTLRRTNGVAYNGVWKRWFPASAISPSSGAYYGLFPLGATSQYRPFAITSSSNPTTAGYVMVTHIDSSTITLVDYTDNESNNIRVISDIHNTVSTVGLAGGTYSVKATYTSLSNTGQISDLRMFTYSNGNMASPGLNSAATGSMDTPTIYRTGLNASQLANTWVIGSKNLQTTPLKQFYYSRKTGNWNDATIGTGTWSLAGAGLGLGCGCVPATNSYVVVSSGHTVTINTPVTIDYLDINNSAVLNDNGTSPLTVRRTLSTFGTGRFENTSNWTIGNNLNLDTNSSCTASGNITVLGWLRIPGTAALAQSAGSSITIQGNVDLQGHIDLGNANIIFSGDSVTLRGSGSIDGSGTSGVQFNANTEISSTASLSIGSSTSPINVSIAAGKTIYNSGQVRVTGNLNGTSALSRWINEENAVLEVSGSLMATGSLDASASPNTVLYSGGGNQTIKVPVSTYYNLSASNAGTKTPAGNLQVSNMFTLSDSVVFDASTYNITGDANLNMSGNSELQLTRSGSGTYPQLTGNYTLTGGTITIRQNSGTDTLTNAAYYHLNLEGTGTHNLSNVTNINGNLHVRNSATFLTEQALTVAGTISYSSSATSALQNNLTAGGIELSAGSFDDGGNTITISGNGNWTNTGAVATLTGSMVFAGNAAQQINGSVPVTFNNLRISNSSGVTLNISGTDTAVVNGTLNLTSGRLFTSPQNMLKLSSTADATLGSVTSYVSGPMIKAGNTDFIFPIGKDGRRGRVSVSGLTDNNTEISAEYFPVAYSDVNSLNDLTGVSQREYWLIDRTGSSDSVKIKLYWDNANFSGLTSNEGLTIAHYTEGAWRDEPALADGTSSFASSGAGSIEMIGTVSTFSPFSFGAAGGGSALPVELVSFTAESKAEVVKTKWITALEINNDYFTVERSEDGANFKMVGKVDGAGNSTTALAYSFIDTDPLEGVSYYRLKQTDFDGQFSYSDIVTVRRNAADVKVSVYPNPAQSDVNIQLSNVSDDVEVKVFDQFGKLMYASIYPATGKRSAQTIQLNVSSLLSSGVYFLNITSGQTVYKEKLIVQ